MKRKKDINRRELLGSAAASSIAFAVVPRQVLGGRNYVAPGDKVTVANIGCGTQGLREMPGMLENEAVRVVAVCDPNKFTTNYIDWSSNGIRNGIRQTLGDATWGEGIEGIPVERLEIGDRFLPPGPLARPDGRKVDDPPLMQPHQEARPLPTLA